MVKKILYFHQHFSTPSGSAGIRSYEMARKLIANGYEVTIVCGSYKVGATGLKGDFVSGSRRGVVDSINVIEFDLEYSNSDHFLKRALTFMVFGIRCIRLLFTEKYDLIFSTSTPLTAGLPGIVGKLLLSKPFVFEVRDLWPELPRAMKVITNPLLLWVLGYIEYLSYKSADRIIGLSPGIVDGIARRGFPRKIIKLIPNGCDLKIFSSDHRNYMRFKMRDEFTAIYSGTHGIANGLDSVIDAAGELQKRKRTNIKIFLVGDGMQKNYLKERVIHEGLKNVIFIDPVEKKVLSKLFNSCDLGLQILKNIPEFYYGTSPNKFFDYISSGLPVLINYPGWLADMIKYNECGFVSNPDNPVELANLLEYAADNPSALNKMGANARLLAENEFNRDKLSEEWVKWVIGALDEKII